jgi:hypothetical protein
VNDFVEQCRREWKRLRVPDAVADEMAADLAADLREAESDGISGAEVLGTGASDPRSFAAAWAAERAVIPPPRWTARAPRRVLLLAAVTALTVVTAVGAALVVFASPHASEPAVAFHVIQPPANVPIRVRIDPPSVTGGAVWVARDGIAMRTPANDSRVEIHRAGSILLIAGIVGMILSMLFLLWSSLASPSRERLI